MIQNTYIIVNNSLINKLKEIPQFNLNLGQALTTQNEKTKKHQFLPNDLTIQSHYSYHNEIIHKLGNIGGLIIYSNVNIQHNTIRICNADKSNDYTINTNIYDSLNNSLNNFLKKHEFIKDDNESKTQKPTQKDIDNNVAKLKEEYELIKHIPLKEMNKHQRIIYARYSK